MMLAIFSHSPHASLLSQQSSCSQSSGPRGRLLTTPQRLLLHKHPASPVNSKCLLSNCSGSWFILTKLMNWTCYYPATAPRSLRVVIKSCNTHKGCLSTNEKAPEIRLLFGRSCSGEKESHKISLPCSSTWF